MSHGNILEVAVVFDGLDGVLLVDIGVAEMDEDYLLCACADILLAELGTVVKTKMPLWMAHAHIVVCEVVQQGGVIMVTLDENCIDVSETVVDSSCVGNK